MTLDGRSRTDKPDAAPSRSSCMPLPTLRAELHGLLGRRLRQQGRFATGLIVGLLLGLAIALVVALWVTQVPVPFVNKVPPRTPEQDAAESDRNRRWDPNAPLSKGAAKPSAQANGAGAPNVVGPPAPATTGPVLATGSTAGGPPFVPAVPPLGGSGTAASSGPAVTSIPPTATTPPARAPAVPAAASTAGAASTTPREATAAASSKAAGSAGDPYVYFVQAGAYSKPEDAEQQKARLAMLGHSARVTEREQVGRTMYRVRIGPFEKKEAAQAAQSKLQGSGVDAALVSVERTP